MRGTRALIVIASLTAVTACGSLGNAPSAQPSGNVTMDSGPPSTSAPAPASCTARACVAAEIQAALLGIEAKDGAVISKATCKASTVKRNPGPTWTARCRVTESDGAVSAGFANLQEGSGTISYEPVDVLTPPGG